jgi:uncharacterized membrane protein
VSYRGQLARPIAIPRELQRWPALIRALLHGVRVEVAPGLVAILQPFVEGNMVHVPYNVAGNVQTPAGVIYTRNAGVVSAEIDTVGRVLTYAESRGAIPRLTQIVDGNGGRPLLNLPR